MYYRGGKMSVKINERKVFWEEVVRLIESDIFLKKYIQIGNNYGHLLCMKSEYLDQDCSIDLNVSKNCPRPQIWFIVQKNNIKKRDKFLKKVKRYFKYNDIPAIIKPVANAFANETGRIKFVVFRKKAERALNPNEEAERLVYLLNNMITALFTTVKTNDADLFFCF